MPRQRKYTIKELTELLKHFYENHPDIYEDEQYAPVRIMEADSVAHFLGWLEEKDYSHEIERKE